MFLRALFLFRILNVEVLSPNRLANVIIMPYPRVLTQGQTMPPSAFRSCFIYVFPVQRHITVTCALIWSRN